MLYHPKKAPQGKRFEAADQTRGLQSRGWYDTPAKFPKPSKLVTFLQGDFKTWWEKWEWMLRPLTFVSSLIGGGYALYKMIF
jgi:hypothetical protein